MNKVFAVYTASEFYKLYFQPQSKYYHSEVTLTSAKREHSHQLHAGNNTLKHHPKACSYCTATLEMKTKFCIKDSPCYRTTLWIKVLYFTLFWPQASTYRDLSHKTVSQQGRNLKSRFYQPLDSVCRLPYRGSPKIGQHSDTPEATSLGLLPQHKKELLKSNAYFNTSFHSRKLSMSLF